ncbi:hypothetical protein EKK58_03375 [Candidatus Dependentiae bacterium]|nr:MAG: hypothetical protein EKK58_03375 [Candidatus Dependentiae bacterium]
MYCIFRTLFALLFVSLYNIHCSDAQDSALFYKDIRLVIRQVTGVYCQPNANSRYETQKLHRHTVQVIQEIDRDWVQVQVDDKTKGYIQKKLIQKNICQNPEKVFSDDLFWRGHKNLMRIKSSAVLVYPASFVKNQSITKLFCNSYIKKFDDLNEYTNNEFIQIELADGSCGWICYGSLEPIEPLDMDEIINRVTEFVGIPYISCKDNNPVPLDELRFLTVTYWRLDKYVHYDGNIIVHAQVAQEEVDVFQELFIAQYPIDKIKLIESYSRIDGYSCADNNSSAFYSRQFTNGILWSLHAIGLAVDINTRLNPYVFFKYNQKDDFVGPVQSKEFVELPILGLITDDTCYNAFIKRGWKWAGQWKEDLNYPYDDYQHFYKDEGLSPELTKLAQDNEPKPKAILPIYNQNSSYL